MTFMFCLENQPKDDLNKDARVGQWGKSVLMLVSAKMRADGFGGMLQSMCICKKCDCNTRLFVDLLS